MLLQAVALAFVIFSAAGGGNVSVGGNAGTTGPFAMGSFTSQGGKVSQAKPQPTDPVCYVSENTGNDANNGLSWGKAKLTVTGCWTTLPELFSSGLFFAGGTIYTSSKVSVGNPLGSNVGLQIAGPNDPNTILASQVVSLVRSGNVVTATLTVAPPSYYVTNATISVFYAQNTTSGLGLGDASFNGNFTLTGVNAGDKTMTWNQTGGNSTVNGGGIILPQGWIPQGSITLSCAAGNLTTANGHIPKCTASWGDTTHPSLRLTGINTPLTFQGMEFLNGQIATQIGVDTNGSRNGTGGVAGVTFLADDFVPATCASCGPGVDIGSNSFWLRFFDCTFDGNVNASGGYLSDQFQTFVVNPGTGGGSGLIFLQNVNTNTGAVKMDAAPNSGIYVDGLSSENETEAGVWIVSPNANTIARIRNVEISDCGSGADCYGVRVDPATNGSTTQTDAVVVQSIAAPIQGPMVCLSGCAITAAGAQIISSTRQGQAGFISGTPQIVGTATAPGGSAPTRLEGTQDEALGRMFSPVAVRFTPLLQTGNVSSSIPANWTTIQGTGTVTSVAAPDGTTNAGRVTQSSGTFLVQACCVNVTPVVGQWYIAGVWARSQTANGFSGANVITLQFSGDSKDKWASTGTSQATVNQFIEGDGEWRYYYTAQKVVATDGSGVSLQFYLRAVATHTIDYYAPVVILIPAGMISDNEALEYALALRSFSGTATAGDVSMLPTQRFRMSVPSSNFQYLWQGVPTADRIVTLPDASFTIAQTSQLPLRATSASIGGSSVNAGQCASGMVSVKDATTSMVVGATPVADPGAAFIPWAFVSSASTVTVRVCNFSSSSATPAATKYNIRVIQ
jgi:hypothetical protein